VSLFSAQDAYGVIPGCTPSIARGGVCSRVVVDSFGTSQDMQDMLQVRERVDARLVCVCVCVFV